MLIEIVNHLLNKRNYLVDFLVLFLGIGSWIGVNCIFVELPLLVESAPEEWNLPAYLSIITQLANVGPLAYSISRKFHQSKKTDTILISCLLGLGAVSILLTAFFYGTTSYLAGSDRSVLLLVLTFANALVGCTSSVLFFPYIGNLKHKYLATYLIGEGLSGLIPSVVSLIQGIGGVPECVDDGESTNTVYPEPLFSLKIFFIIMTVIIIISFVSFLLLHNLDTCKNERIEEKPECLTVEKFEDKNKGYIPSKVRTNTEKWVILLLAGVISAIGNSFLLGIKSYSCLPYGVNAYHLAANLGMVSNPVACLIGMFFLYTSNRSLIVQFSTISLIISYLITTAALSPTPPLYDAQIGVVIIVTAWTLAFGLITYFKVCSYTIFRNEGGNWMFYTGCAVQMGSFIGSVISFVIVNVLSVFVAKETCE